MRFAFVLYFVGALVCAAEPSQPSTRGMYSDLKGVSCDPLKPNSVLIFYWHDCPICNTYAPEINRIADGHTNFAFYIVQVDPDLTVAAAKKHAKDFDLHPPVLLDSRHELVRKLKAVVTPEAIVLGTNGECLYRGRIDNLYAALGKKRGIATTHELRDALEAIIAGKKVLMPETKAIGCLIQTNKK